MAAVKAVIDTNIWVSSILNPFGFPVRLRKSFEEGAFNVVISAPMLEELSDVLNRPKIKEEFETYLNLPSTISNILWHCFERDSL